MMARESGHEIIGRGLNLAPSVYAFVGRDLYDVRQSEHRILITFAGVLGASIVLAGLSGLWLSRRYLRRVDAISNTCRAIMAGRLSDRIVTQRTGGELERLASTINSMLDRIQLLMESLRQVSNDIAHDLRTPLVHLRYSLEKALAEAGSEKEFEAAARQAITEADQLLEMFAALLRIARIESGSRREAFQQLDLGDLVVQAFAMYKPVLEDANRPASTNISPGIKVWGDRQLLLQLIANLLDNAVNHTPPGTHVTAWVGMLNGCPSLMVADTGLGVPAAERERVLRRFFRLEQSRTTPGHGLGLSMVAAIVDLHDARITLSDNKPGLRITVQFPASVADSSKREASVIAPA
jgi:signal transduction histidine kinase